MRPRTVADPSDPANWLSPGERRQIADAAQALAVDPADDDAAVVVAAHECHYALMFAQAHQGRPEMIERWMLRGAVRSRRRHEAEGIV